MKRSGSQNDFAERLDGLRRERDAIRFERARLDARNEELVRREERLRIEMTETVQEPYLLRSGELAKRLGISAPSFSRLIRNSAKGFPKPVTALDSDHSWKWSDVKEWLG